VQAPTLLPQPSIKNPFLKTFLCEVDACGREPFDTGGPIAECVELAGRSARLVYAARAKTENVFDVVFAVFDADNLRHSGDPPHTALEPRQMDDQPDAGRDVLTHDAMGSSSAVMATIILSRDNASRVSFAWIVVSEPSCPVFIACSMSSASPPRTSPTMIRSGRIRRLFRTRSRWVASPVPSMLASRVSSRTTCGCCRISSAESSIVITRSSWGVNPDRASSNVVFPAPVPPESRTLARAWTAAARNCIISGGAMPLCTRLSALSRSAPNRRIDNFVHQFVEHSPMFRFGQLPPQVIATFLGKAADFAAQLFFVDFTDQRQVERFEGAREDRQKSEE